LDDLWLARNAACTAAIQNALKNNIPLGGAQQNILACLFNKGSKRNLVPTDNSLRTVIVHMKAALGGSDVEMDLKMVFEVDGKVAPAIHLTAEALEFVIRAIHEDASDGSRGIKRDRDSRISFSSQNAHWNYERKAAYVSYVDADGRRHTYHQKPCKSLELAQSPEEVTELLDALGEELDAYYHANNHGVPLSIEDAVDGGAADHGAEDAGDAADSGEAV